MEMVASPWSMPDERQRYIREHLALSGRVLAIDLAQKFGVSEDTVRRDLRELAAAGLCRRVYGGALPLSKASGTIAQREGEQTVRKEALGRAGAALVAKLVRPHEVLLLDAGSTNLAVATALPPDLRITVVTNAPNIAAALTPLAGIELIMIGGRIDARCGAALGARAARDLDAIRIDLALLGTCAIDPAAGLAAFDIEDAEFKQTAAKASAMVMTIATNEKLGTSAPFSVLPCTRLTHLVVEGDAPPDLIGSFQAVGVEIHRAPPPKSDRLSASELGRAS